jgi:hypothetical protein
VWAGYWVPESTQIALAAPDITTYDPPAKLYFAGGNHVGYKFSDSGAVLGSKSYTLAHASSASTGSRRNFPGQPGYWFYVVNGVWAGYWVPESTQIALAA